MLGPGRRRVYDPGVAVAIVIGVIVVVVIGFVFVSVLSRRSTARDAAGAGGDAVAGPDPESLLGDRDDRQTADEEAARRRRGAG
jgi:hypothetical protein